MKTTLLLMIAAVAGLSAYALQRSASADAIPAAEGPIPQIIIVAPRVVDERR